ncbi:MAG TPA: M23 family metallopeptidase [Usitatibacter sp.]|nr:M23 family metallopeptidase [Usitatibacter sp.]
MATVKATAMVALLSALATLGIAASVKQRATRAETPSAAPAAVPLRETTPPPLLTRRLTMPVQGYDPRKLQDNFDDMRGGIRRHEALDIMAPRGTPVVAADDGEITKLFRSVAGGITVYQADASQNFVYYYAHLDRYREGLKEGDTVRRGDVIGYVGSTGNAPASAPHLHFTIFELGPDRKWWRGKAVNPYPFLAAR